MTFSKPYLSGDKEYLEVYQKKTFEEGDPQGLTEYSEGQYPYNEDEDDHPEWEWTWPNIPFPNPLDITDTDEVPGPCSGDDECKHAAIAGPDTIKCPTPGIYNQAHVFVGCTIAPEWAAFGKWEITDNYSEDIFILTQSGVMCTIEVPVGTPSGEITLTYSGPLDCSADKVITIDCACCNDLMFADFTDTDIAAGGTFLGWLDPLCPNAVATVEWLGPSECDPPLEDVWITANSTDPDGRFVSITTDGAACGSFRVTVTDSTDGCSDETATIVVFITDNGSDYHGYYEANSGCGGLGWPPPGYAHCTAAEGVETQVSSVDDEEYRYGRGYEGSCTGGIYYYCSACSDCGTPSGYGEDCSGCGDEAYPTPPVTFTDRVPGSCPDETDWPGGSGCSCGGDCSCFPCPSWDECTNDYYDWDQCRWDCDCPAP